MQAMRFANALAAVLLVNGILALCVSQEVFAQGKVSEAKKYTAELKGAKDAKTKVTALTELGKLGAIMKGLTEDAMPDILKAMEDKDATVRSAAAQCLGKCDPDPDKAVPALVKMLTDDKNEDAKIGAAKGLAAMGASAKAAADDLRKVIKDADKKSALGKQANIALKSINGKAK
jgi:HEAT repeat protein